MTKVGMGPVGALRRRIAHLEGQVIAEEASIEANRAAIKQSEEFVEAVTAEIAELNAAIGKLEGAV